MRIVILAAALALTGCAPKLAFSNEAGGVIDQQASMGNDRAYALAEEHCKKYGKVAKISGTDIIENTTRFECVVG